MKFRDNFALYVYDKYSIQPYQTMDITDYEILTKLTPFLPC